jgi:hypothetical protein
MWRQEGLSLQGRGAYGVHENEVSTAQFAA